MKSGDFAFGSVLSKLFLIALATGVSAAFAHADRGHVLDTSEENMERDRRVARGTV